MMFKLHDDDDDDDDDDNDDDDDDDGSVKTLGLLHKPSL